MKHFYTFLLIALSFTASAQFSGGPTVGVTINNETNYFTGLSFEYQYGKFATGIEAVYMPITVTEVQELPRNNFDDPITYQETKRTENGFNVYLTEKYYLGSKFNVKAGGYASFTDGKSVFGPVIGAEYTLYHGLFTAADFAIAVDDTAKNSFRVGLGYKF